MITDLEKVSTKLVNANVKQNIYSNEKEKINLIDQYHKQLITIDTEINEHKNKIIELKNKIDELECKKNRIGTKVSKIAANDLDEKISRSEGLLELYEKW